MAQPGYLSCIGCGRLFKKDSPAEMVALLQHDCDWDDEQLDELIGQIQGELNA